MGEKSARQWQFWRRAFWLRPALLMLYAVLLGLLGLGLVLASVGQVRDARAMDGAPRCAPDHDRAQAEDQDCLVETEGTLDGPHYNRGPGSEWWFDDGTGESHDVDVGTAGSQRLDDADGDRVTGLYWEGELVAFEVDGSLVESDNYGMRQPSWILWLGMGCLGGALMLQLGASVRRQQLRGWWSTDARDPDDTDRTDGADSHGALVPWRLIVAAALFLPACVGVIAIGFGASVTVSWIAYALAVAVVLVAVVRRATMSQPTHAAA